MNDSRKKILKIFLSSGTLVPGPILYLLYKRILLQHFGICASLFSQRMNLALVIATFSFTMLGFLAGIITILFSFGGTKTFKRYRRKGYFETLIFIYFFTIANLVFTFGLSLLSFSDYIPNLLFNLMIMSSVNNIIQVSVITIVLVNLTRRINEES